MIYETAPIGLAFLSTDCRYLLINHHLTEICGISVADHIGRSVRETVPQVADQVEEIVRTILRTGVPITGIEVSGQRPDKKNAQRSWMTYWHPLRDRNAGIVGINAGNSLLSQLTGALAIKIFLIGFVACTVPPFVVWAIGFHFFKINPAVLMGGVAGARSHSGPCREAAKEIDSSVPWIGFPVAYAISGILLTIGGFFAMVAAG